MKKITLSTIVLFVLFIKLYSQELTYENKMLGLAKLWKEVSYNFAYPERLEAINWDSLYIDYIPKVEKAKSLTEYYDILGELIARLDNSHTDIYITPDYSSGKLDYYQLTLNCIEGKLCVVNMPQSLKTEIPRGSVVTEIDSIESMAYLKKYYLPKSCAPSFQGKMNRAIGLMNMGVRGSSVKLTCLTPDNRRKEILLTRNVWEKGGEEWVYPNKMWDGGNPEFNMLEGNVAYMKFISFQNSHVDTISRLLDTHWDEIKHSKSIIIDLRGNVGGTDGAWTELARRLCEGDSLRYCLLRSRVNSSYYKAKGAFSDGKLTSLIGIKCHESPYSSYYHGTAFEDIPIAFGNQIHSDKRLTQPVYLLIDSNTCSAGEGFVLAMKEMNRATILGEPTAGCLGQPLLISLPGGGVARICTVKTMIHGGNEDVSEKGIQPDIEINATIEDIFQNKDSVLERALLLSRKKSR